MVSNNSNFMLPHSNQNGNKMISELEKKTCFEKDIVSSKNENEYSVIVYYLSLPKLKKRGINIIMKELNICSNDAEELLTKQGSVRKAIDLNFDKKLSLQKI